MKKRFLFFLIVGGSFLGMAQKNRAGEKLDSIIQVVEAFELYDKDDYPLGRFSEVLSKKDAEFAKAQLARLMSINGDSLTETESISLDLLRFELQNRVDRYTFQMHLNPIQANQGFHLNLNYRVKPILSYQDAKKYLETLNAVPQYVEEHITLLRAGLEKGLSQPKIIFKGYESTYDVHTVEDYSQNNFFAPFDKLPESLSETQRDSVLIAAKEAIGQSVVPSFNKIKTFFEEEYIPGTRSAIGVSETPNGHQFYQNRINYYTTTDSYTAEDIHQLGLKEVARIKTEMQEIIKEVGFEGSFQEFLNFLRTDAQFYASSGKDLLREARNIAKKIDAELPKYFKTLPRKPYGVKKVPDAIYTTQTRNIKSRLGLG